MRNLDYVAEQNSRVHPILMSAVCGLVACLAITATAAGAKIEDVAVSAQRIASTWRIGDGKFVVRNASPDIRYRIEFSSTGDDGETVTQPEANPDCELAGTFTVNSADKGEIEALRLIPKGTPGASMCRFAKATCDPPAAECVYGFYQVTHYSSTAGATWNKMAQSPKIAIREPVRD